MSKAINGIFQPKKTEREPPIPLPINYVNDKRRLRLMELYASKLLCKTDISEILPILEPFYEQVYGIAIAERDKIMNSLNNGK